MSIVSYHKNIFIDLFKGFIPNKELNDFMDFLRLTNSYNDFFRLMDLFSLKAYIRAFGCDSVYSTVILYALNFCRHCKDEERYWYVMSRLNKFRLKLQYGNHYIIGDYEHTPTKENFDYDVNSLRELLEDNKNSISYDKYQKLNYLLSHIVDLKI